MEPNPASPHSGQAAVSGSAPAPAPTPVTPVAPVMDVTPPVATPEAVQAAPPPEAEEIDTKSEDKQTKADAKAAAKAAKIEAQHTAEAAKAAAKASKKAAAGTSDTTPAIVATVIIVLGLSLLAVIAYLQSQK